jgi:hypothetical protein
MTPIIRARKKRVCGCVSGREGGGGGGGTNRINKAVTRETIY